LDNNYCFGSARHDNSRWFIKSTVSFIFSQSRAGFRRIAAIILLCVMAGCGNPTIVGKWRMSGTENQTLWEFSSNGSVLVGEVRGRYKFGDQDRIKIETPFATTVYLVNLSSDQLVLQELGGSKLEFTRMKEAQR
jgi:hypothetical protein